MRRQTLFAAGEGGYSTYRIPSCIALPGGHVLLFCEGRRDSSEDWGCIRILTRASDDGLRFGPPRVIAQDGENTVGNPTPLYDRDTRETHLMLNGNRRDGGEGSIMRGLSPRTVWTMKSSDAGESWSALRDITPSAKLPGWTWHAVGPCHAIQLRSGRLLVPCNHAELDEARGESGPYISGALYSDDHGATWLRGADVGPYTNECAAVELADGRVYMNMRSYLGRHRRAVAYSDNGGESWSAPILDEALVEPVCQGSALGMPDGALLFANPASEKRERLTLRMSLDGGRTWPRSLLVNEGPSAYCDMCLLPDGCIFLLFECGESGTYERIDAAWIRPEEVR